MSAIELALITLIFELIELFLQYSSTLKESVFKMYKIYQKSPFLFFASNLGYIWILFLAISTNNLNWPLILAIALKTFDILTKVDLINRIFIKRNSADIEAILDMKVPFWVYFVGPLTYPYIVYIAFS
jgi:hypothetical protein